MELRLGCRRVKDLVARRDLQRREFRGFGEVIRQSRADPLEQDVVFLGAALEPLTAFVSNLRCWLQQNETLFRFERIGSTRKGIASEDVVIEFRIFAAERKLETSFTILVAVACAGIASGFGNYGHHVIAKRNAG